MKQDTPKPVPAADRRSFLKLASVGAVSAGAMAAAGQASAATEAPKAEDGGYRETEHIKRYYDLARF